MDTPPSGKSPFAHRAARAETSTEPVAAPPVSAPRKGFPVAPVFAGAVAIAAIAAAVVVLSPGENPKRPETSSPAPEKKPVVSEKKIQPVATTPEAALARLDTALERARRLGCETTSPAGFARALALRAEAVALKTSGKAGDAVTTADRASTIIETNAYEAARRSRTVASDRSGIPDVAKLAGETGEKTETLTAKAATALAAGDTRTASEAMEAALRNMPSVVTAARIRLRALAVEAENRGEFAAARIFRIRLFRSDRKDAESETWLMRRGIAAGDTLTTPKLGIAFAYAPPGTFFEGSPAGEPGRGPDETRRKVTLTRGFRLGVTTVTQGQWDAVMGRGAAAAKLSREKTSFTGADLPMTDITVAEAEAFCRRLSAIEGATFRLPTEAEWEYACRAGSDTPYSTGKSFLAPGEAVVDDGTTRAPDAPRAVSSPAALVNARGLRDMHGNVWQWCADRYAARDGADATDPVEKPGADGNAARVVRGGSWNDPAPAARSAKRWRYPPSVAVNYIGFRVLMEFDAASLAE